MLCRQYQYYILCYIKLSKKSLKTHLVRDIIPIKIKRIDSMSIATQWADSDDIVYCSGYVQTNYYKTNSYCLTNSSSLKILGLYKTYKTTEYFY